jgi:hypothetical protein
MTVSGNIEIRPYQDCDWEQLRNFTKKNWREDHPFCNRRLFDWQFAGFGNQNKKIHSLIMFHGNEVIGFRGVIPGLYQVPSERNGMDVVQGGSLAMWMIGRDFRGKGLGMVMHHEAQKSMPVITGAGSNPKTSVPIYVKNGFSVLESMHRYVAPLQAEGYQKLLTQNAEITEIQEWASTWDSSKPAIPPSKPDIGSIAAVWRQATFPLRIFSLYRSAEFWRWRYLDSAGFKYLFFGKPREVGVIVARTERIYSNEIQGLHGQKVFRIIEVLPRDSQAWTGELDTALVELIQGATRWAIRQGCLAADFYCSTSRLAPTMEAAGFRKQNITSGFPVCSLALLFQPLKYTARPINALFRIETTGKSLVQVDFEDTYQVKSDNDMDRPNLYDFEELN